MALDRDTQHKVAGLGGGGGLGEAGAQPAGLWAAPGARALAGLTCLGLRWHYPQFSRLYQRQPAACPAQPEVCSSPLRAQEKLRCFVYIHYMFEMIIRVHWAD